MAGPGSQVLTLLDSIYPIVLSIFSLRPNLEVGFFFLRSQGNQEQNSQKINHKSLLQL